MIIKGWNWRLSLPCGSTPLSVCVCVCVCHTRIYVAMVVLNTGTADNTVYCLSFTGHAASRFLVETWLGLVAVNIVFVSTLLDCCTDRRTSSTG